jgi:hypothetical protein
MVTDPTTVEAAQWRRLLRLLSSGIQNGGSATGMINDMADIK